MHIYFTYVHIFIRFRKSKDFNEFEKNCELLSHSSKINILDGQKSLRIRPILNDI